MGAGTNEMLQKAEKSENPLSESFGGFQQLSQNNVHNLLQSYDSLNKNLEKVLIIQ